MPPLDALPPDQRAVLQLVLKQGRSYEDIAGLLRIDADAVRGRAHAGLDAIAPDVGRRLAPDRRGEVGDYLLGQQTVSARAETRRHLAGSAAARAWARVVADTLEPLARDPLPEIPEGEAEAEDDAPAAAAAAAGATAARERPRRDAAKDDGEETVEETREVSEPARRRDRAVDSDQPGPSRLGGALLLAGLGILVAVVIIVLVSGGNDKKNTTSTPTTGTVASTTPSTTAGTGNATLPTTGRNLGQGFTLVGGAIMRPAEKGSKAKAVASLVYQKSSKGYGFTIRATGMPSLADQYFGVWLSNPAGASELIGVVRAKLVKNGAFAVSANVPADVRRFRDMLLSRESIKSSSQRPKSPSEVIVSGPLQIING